MSRFELIEQEREAYGVRISATLVLSLLLLIAAFRFWPAPNGDVPDIVYDARAQELIQVEDIQQTQQQARRPPPPRPLTPVIVPDDVVLDEPEIELTENLPINDLGDDNVAEEDGADVPVSGGSARPDSGPRAFRIVEPEYPREAQRRKVRAEVVVEVKVDRRGRVESARIVDRFLLKGRDNREREQVALLGYGLEDAAIDAAQQWQFRPARESGQTVAALTLVTISFGA
ncbi:MAG: energy transducer TonB [Rhodothermales bacterium]|nr:energy transducer TonB [Rhodothermales bacterium]MBO6780195.1 energy transducer TonB [Rhodothermales bacterium]